MQSKNVGSPISVVIIGQVGFALGEDGVLHVRLLCTLDGNGSGARVEKLRSRAESRT
jgi:hypothetical protein